MFFKNCVFPQKYGEPLPNLIGPFCFRPIEIFKIWERESLSVSTDRGWFSTDRNSWISFLFKKDRFGLFQSYFSNSSFLFSLSALALGSTIQFLLFSFKIFARFLSLEAGKSLLPFFFKFISWFHAFFMHYHGYFRTFIILGFLMIRTYSCEIDQWVFVLWCYNDVPYSLIWSILWFLKNWKF